jgi:hypothetical protein
MVLHKILLVGALFATHALPHANTRLEASVPGFPFAPNCATGPSNMRISRSPSPLHPPSKALLHVTLETLPGGHCAGVGDCVGNGVGESLKLGAL